jgi:tol-pal system protein YbgF
LSAARAVAVSVAVGLVAAGCATTPPDQDPVQIKLNDLDTRLARIERVMANQSMLDLANQTEALRGDLRAVHNDIDVLNHNLEATRKQQRDLYADVDRRLKSLESRAAPGPGAAGSVDGGAGAGAAGGGVAGGAGGAAGGGAGFSGGAGYGGAAGGGAASGPDDKTSYQAAFDLLKNSQYDRAIPAFQKFLLTFPDSPLADNAQYWLGETYYVNKSFPEAQDAFQRVVDKYPQSRKRPDAMLKIGYCRYELQQWDSARQILMQVTSQFPGTPAGQLAQQRLDKMAAEKH